MGDINLYKISGQVAQLSSSAFGLERELQVLVERSMDVFFGVKFLASEFTIGGGRIDSLGIDENDCPVIFEYKRSQNENVINQGLFYLDWLMDHKAEFKLLAIEKLGMEAAGRIDWTIPCVICIASDFTRYDEHAVKQMQRNIKLVKYRRFGEDLLLFEQINAPDVKPVRESEGALPQPNKTRGDKTFAEQLAGTTDEIREIYYALRGYTLSLGDDVAENELKLYSAFKKTKNIACVEIRSKSMLLYLRLDPDSIPQMHKGLIRDVRGIGHWGTGDTEITIKSAADYESIKYLLNMSYNEN